MLQILYWSNEAQLNRNTVYSPKTWKKNNNMQTFKSELCSPLRASDGQAWWKQVWQDDRSKNKLIFSLRNPSASFKMEGSPDITPQIWQVNTHAHTLSAALIECKCLCWRSRSADNGRDWGQGEAAGGRQQSQVMRFTTLSSHCTPIPSYPPTLPSPNMIYRSNRRQRSRLR